ncbi:hypothetical protein [Aquimarina spongiae]|uniref:Uncharacterized protein n=1 Tax=Aquimarina spongiae TaxID=570521 RepID=A0A1M6KRG5_9FLAO|nr:hypothetical protein [Aquimarina spongiae]SHJ61522.1 hypothetical protein SAMN04488508_11227 [Aquimarina spongiae]
MKKLAVVVLAIVLGTSSLFASNENPTKNAEKDLRNQIAVLLERPEIKVEKQELTADIEFVLNNKGEIVVLSVDAEKEIIEDYVKARLNYKKVDLENVKIGNKLFQLTLKIVKPQA